MSESTRSTAPGLDVEALLAWRFEETKPLLGWRRFWMTSGETTDSIEYDLGSDRIFCRMCATFATCEHQRALRHFLGLPVPPDDSTATAELLRDLASRFDDPDDPLYELRELGRDRRSARLLTTLANEYAALIEAGADKDRIEVVESNEWSIEFVDEDSGLWRVHTGRRPSGIPIYSWGDTWRAAIDNAVQDAAARTARTPEGTP